MPTKNAKRLTGADLAFYTILLSGLLVSFSTFLHSFSKGTITVENRSTVSVLEGKLSVGNTRFKIPLIKSGGTLSFEFLVDTGQSYEISVLLANRKTLSASKGYLVHGQICKDRLIVVDDEIEFLPNHQASGGLL